jgi:hypothetical protein
MNEAKFLELLRSGRKRGLQDSDDVFQQRKKTKTFDESLSSSGHNDESLDVKTAKARHMDRHEPLSTSVEPDSFITPFEDPLKSVNSYESPASILTESSDPTQEQPSPTIEESISAQYVGSSEPEDDEIPEPVNKNLANPVKEKTIQETQLRRPHKSLIKDMFHQLEIMEDLATPTLSLDNMLAFNKAVEINKAALKVLDDRHEKQLQGKPAKENGLSVPYPILKEDFEERLRGEEQDKHPWGMTSKLPKDFLLRRVTDDSSKARMYHDAGFFAQSAKADFATFKGRREAIGRHLNYGNRRPTALISWTGCPKDFIENRVQRQERRKKPGRETRKLHYVSVLSLKADGVPVMYAEHEAQHYKVHRGIGAGWIKDEFLTLCRVHIKHIVGTWYLADAQKYMDQNKCNFDAWESEAVLPALEEHELARKEGRPYVPKNGCVCCPHSG